MPKQIEGGPFGEKIFRKKVSQCRKKLKGGDPLVSPGMVCYAGKQEKPFWLSSLGQMVKFGAIIFCSLRTILVSSCVLKKKKKKVTIIVAFHFTKRRLKTYQLPLLCFMNLGLVRNESIFGLLFTKNKTATSQRARHQAQKALLFLKKLFLWKFQEISVMPKKSKGRTLLVFNRSSLAENVKKSKGDRIFC